MLDLRIGKHLIDRIDRTAWHAGLIESFDPVGTWTLGGQLVDFRIQCVTILRSVRSICIFGPPDQLRCLERMTETLPDFLTGGCDVDVAIRSLENAGWNAGGVIVAGLFRDLAFDKPARGLEIK